VTRRDQPSIAVEASLVAVHVAVALGFARLFDGGDHVRPLLAFVLVAHGLAIATRRLRVPALGAIAIAIAGAAVTTTWLLFPDTRSWGLPTAATWDAASSAVAEARELFPEVIAPTEAVPGFLLASGLALWTACWFADWTAHRLRASAEAIAPAAAVFTFCAILGSGRHEVAAAAGFAATALAFIALQRGATLERDQSWSPDAAPAARSLRRTAVAVGAVAVLAGAIVGPTLPGATSTSLVDWRGQGAGDGSRVTISPMVELNRRLVEQSDVQVFSVEASARSYWRLTSLDRFDGEIWSSNGEFRPADEELPSASPIVQEGAPIVQAIEIDALAAIWAPAAYEAIGLRSSDEELRWDPASSTLIVDSGRSTSDGLQYTVVSQAPTFDPEVLARTGTIDPDAIAERYEELPAAFPDDVAALARDLTREAPDRYRQALALQDWFRSEFEYSLDAPAGHGDDALVDFLERRVGYCEQFSGAYAAMARSLGIPARVAVGFTPGEEDPDQPGRYVVRGRHAHAWPEVYFPGIGWVPFEPTPSRGLPGGEAHTGVPEQQDDSQGGAVGSETTTTTTEADEPTAPSSTGVERTTIPPRTRAESTDAAAGGDSDASAPDRRPLLAAVLAALAVGAVVWWRRRGERRRATQALGPAERAWRDVADALRTQRRIASDPAETPLELARRAAALHPELEEPLVALAELVTAERWAPGADGAPGGGAIEAHRRAVLAMLAERRQPVDA
jgi:transglutaminase-like putative cysteine protease